jgi:phenylacetate-coenzyme A ligase PaaK-like adenylate-forming protein
MGKLIFLFVHLAIRPKVLFYYILLRKNERSKRQDIENMQHKKLRNYITFCSVNIPFYADRMPPVSQMDDYGGISSFINKIPILTKDEVFKNKSCLELPKLKVGAYKNVQTGGSTGRPLKYRLSKECDDWAFATLYRGLSRGGYRLGDKLAVMAGGSLVGKKQNFKTTLISIGMNMRKYSSYGISNSTFQEYYDDIVSWNPRFIRGYASSIFEFAKFVDKNGYNLKFKSVFTTAEMLLDNQRKFIEDVFNAEVFNGYGLNDGGVTAFECEYHNGFHIDLERSYVEVVDESEKSVFDEVGRIVSTSFRNKATPFIRYDTGDLGIITKDKCSCGSPYPLLIKLIGRSTDALNINGKVVGSPVLTVLMSKINAIRYQFVQLSDDELLLVVEKNDKYNTSDEEKVSESLVSNLGDFRLRFSYDVNDFEVVSGGKHKVVIDKRTYS